MSGIYIHGMEMPLEGEYHMTLYVCSDGSAYIDVASFPVDKDRFEAVPVPDHGRLIDADAFATEAINSFMDCADLFDDANSLAKAAEIVDAFVRDINEAPTASRQIRRASE